VLQKHLPSTFGDNANMENKRSQPKHFTPSRTKSQVECRSRIYSQTINESRDIHSAVGRKQLGVVLRNLC